MKVWRIISILSGTLFVVCALALLASLVAYFFTTLDGNHPQAWLLETALRAFVACGIEALVYLHSSVKSSGRKD